MRPTGCPRSTATSPAARSAETCRRSPRSRSRSSPASRQHPLAAGGDREGPGRMIYALHEGAARRANPGREGHAPPAATRCWPSAGRFGSGTGRTWRNPARTPGRRSRTGTCSGKTGRSGRAGRSRCRSRPARFATGGHRHPVGLGDRTAALQARPSPDPRAGALLQADGLGVGHARRQERFNFNDRPTWTGFRWKRPMWSLCTIARPLYLDFGALNANPGGYCGLRSPANRAGTATTTSASAAVGGDRHHCSHTRSRTATRPPGSTTPVVWRP